MHLPTKSATIRNISELTVNTRIPGTIAGPSVAWLKNKSVGRPITLNAKPVGSKVIKKSVFEKSNRASAGLKVQYMYAIIVKPAPHKAAINLGYQLFNHLHLLANPELFVLLMPFMEGPVLEK